MDHQRAPTCHCLRIVFCLESLRNALKATARAIVDHPAQAFNIFFCACAQTT